jgi:cytoskeletal protein CcmA (bactofilin family)
MQMDQLAESGLEHARGLILHPQEAPADFWTNGAAAQQLIAGSQDYYDIVKTERPDPADYCTYNIKCEAYRKLADGQKTGRSRLTATLRLDPCIALAVGANTTLWSGVKVYGDVYSKNGLVNNGAIYGDVFATSFAGMGTKTGQLISPQTLLLDWDWPKLAVTDFTSTYSYGPLSGQTFGPYDPPRVCYSSTSLTLSGSTQINGMLLVGGNLTVGHGANASRIVAAKNLPALYVSGKLEIEDVNDLRIDGLVVVGGDVHIKSPASVTIVGGLFVGGALNLDGPGSVLTIIADPVRAAIVEGATGSQTSWSPAAGGFFKSIGRWDP